MASQLFKKNVKYLQTGLPSLYSSADIKSFHMHYETFHSVTEDIPRRGNNQVEKVPLSPSRLASFLVSKLNDLQFLPISPLI